MATDKQNDVKVSPMGEKKGNSSDGGLGLESILYSTGCGGEVYLFSPDLGQKLKLAC